jgi:formate hydrogenlyase subunit 3/multisubunit Na+/H+ antiporter MnhD subunit
VVYSSFGGSLFLIAVGAILRFAINADLDWIELHTTGDILMGTGAAILLLTFFLTMRGGRPPYEPPPPPPPAP